MILTESFKFSNQIFNLSFYIQSFYIKYYYFTYNEKYCNWLISNYVLLITLNQQQPFSIVAQELPSDQNQLQDLLSKSLDYVHKGDISTSHVNILLNGINLNQSEFILLYDSTPLHRKDIQQLIYPAIPIIRSIQFLTFLSDVLLICLFCLLDIQNQYQNLARCAYITVNLDLVIL